MLVELLLILKHISCAST